MFNVHLNCFFVISICCIGVPCKVSLSLGKALYKLNILLLLSVIQCYRGCFLSCDNNDEPPPMPPQNNECITPLFICIMIHMHDLLKYC